MSHCLKVKHILNQTGNCVQAVSSSAVRSWKMSLWQTVASLQFLRRCTLMRYTYFHSCLLKEVKLEKNLSIAIFHIYSCFVVLRGGGVRTGRISLTKQFPYKCFNICLVFLSFICTQRAFLKAAISLQQNVQVNSQQTNSCLTSKPKVE